MIIDMHVHIFPDRIAGRVLRQLGDASSCPPVCLGTASDTRQKMIDWGVDKYVLAPVGTSPLCHASNLFSLESASDMAIPFGTVHPAAQDVEGEVERLAEMGMKGIKVHPQYQHTLITDPGYERIIRRASRLGLPVIFHAGEDPGHPPPCLALPADIVKLLNRIEDIDNLALIAAHMGGLYMYDDVEYLLCGRNIYLDTSLSPGRLNPEQFGRILDKHGYQRLLLGSDCPWQAADVNIAYVRDLGLPQEQEAAILGGNAARLLKLETASKDNPAPAAG